MILLDTHAWVWWIGDPAQLSDGARRAVSRAAGENGVHVSCMSSWEVAMLAACGRLKLTLAVEDWIRTSESLPGLKLVPVDNQIALRSVQLPDYPHRDPVDRILIATALTLGLSLVTKDRRLRGYPRLETIW